MINKEKEMSVERNIDILYSLIVHESPECVLDMISNIYLANKKQKVYVIIHCNREMYILLTHMTKNNPSLLEHFRINPQFFDKKLYQKDLMNAHYQNFQYMKKSGYIFDYFCLLASNCLFVKPFDMNEIRENILDENEYTQSSENGLRNWDFERKTFMNKNLIEFFLHHKMKIIHEAHEGAIYKRNVFDKIIHYTRRFELMKKIRTRIPVEELLLPVLENYICNGLNPRICKVYWDRKNFTPTIEDINMKENYMVKRIDRKLNDRLRVYIRNEWIKEMGLSKNEN